MALIVFYRPWPVFLTTISEKVLNIAWGLRNCAQRRLRYFPSAEHHTCFIAGVFEAFFGVSAKSDALSFLAKHNHITSRSALRHSDTTSGLSVIEVGFLPRLGNRQCTDADVCQPHARLLGSIIARAGVVHHGSDETTESGNRHILWGYAVTMGMYDGRGDRIRTYDLRYPKPSRYQAAPRPDWRVLAYETSAEKSKPAVIRTARRRFRGQSTDDGPPRPPRAPAWTPFHR